MGTYEDVEQGHKDVANKENAMSAALLLEKWQFNTTWRWMMDAFKARTELVPPGGRVRAETETAQRMAEDTLSALCWKKEHCDALLAALEPVLPYIEAELHVLAGVVPSKKTDKACSKEGAFLDLRRAIDRAHGRIPN